MDSMKTLEEIPSPGHATQASWKDYPREVMEHPERNRPEAVRWLIDKYTGVGDRVYDPMAGSGTMLREALRLQRRPYGDEI
jgi:DNA modification methylase